MTLIKPEDLHKYVGHEIILEEKQTGKQVSVSLEKVEDGKMQAVGSKNGNPVYYNGSLDSLSSSNVYVKMS